MLWTSLIRISTTDRHPLQVQIRRAVVAAIGDGRLRPGTRLPSSRELATALDVARNTVVLAYQQLADEGIITTSERSGHFVAQRSATSAPRHDTPVPESRVALDWEGRFARRPSRHRAIEKPRDWQSKPYPFVHGQPDASLFPVNDWRECVRGALAAIEIRDWARDSIDSDDDQLIEELRRHVLPMRGIFASPAEVMITLGAQQALHLLMTLMTRAGEAVGIEDPGYPDARNIAALAGARVVALPVDGDGLVPGDAAAGCRLLFVTPSHQCPTTVTMPLARRTRLLELAAASDALIIEDDYEIERPLPGRTPLPALKSLDATGRVLYVGSLSKTFAPGLRLGFVVAPEPVIAELRALRRLMHRHAPANNQRALSHFIALGHYESHLTRLSRAMDERGAAIDAALAAHLPTARATRGPGASSVWLQLPAGAPVDLVARALGEGVVVEDGAVFFAKAAVRPRFLRLGISAIATPRIEPGIRRLAELIR